MLIEPLVIYGPAGCGKTRNAEALAAHFGAATIVDSWDGTTPLRGSALALSNATGPESLAYSSMSFEAAMDLVRNCPFCQLIEAMEGAA